MRVGSSNMAICFFHSSYLPNLQSHNYYIITYSPFMAFHWYWNRINRWPWMTLNGHLVLKSVLRSACHGFAHSSFQTKLFVNLHGNALYCQWQKCSLETPVSDSISFMQLFTGAAWREHQTGKLYSQLSHVLFTEVVK